MTIQEAAAALRSKSVSSVELTQGCLKAIARENKRLNTFLTVLDESALAKAASMDEELRRSGPRSALHGIPVALKDVFCTKGVRTTLGSKLFENYVPDHDSAVTERLEAAGAVLVGKTGMHELAYGVTSNNPHFGPVRNPWNPDHIPGGSSGGSGAAVPTGMALMAMGSDTGGSIRIPAAYCGCTGIKPTTGRVSRHGVLPLDFTLDHMGPLTRSVRDAALCLEILAGHDPRDDSSSHAAVSAYVPPPNASIRGLRIGIPKAFFYDSLNPEVEAAVRKLAALAETLGAILTEVEVPDMAAINAIGRVILLSEASACLSRHLGDRSKFGSDVLALLDQGRLIPATDYVNAQRLRRIYQQKFERVWEKAEVLLTPCTPVPAPRIGEATIDSGGRQEDVRLASTRLVRAINVLGNPALSIPCGLTTNRLPIGAQIIGRRFDERTVFLAGAALEDAMPGIGMP